MTKKKNLNTMRKFFTVVFVFSLVLKGFSQDTIRISRAELEQRMVDQNLQVKLANDEAKLAQAELLGTRAMYLPNVNASYTFSNTNNPLYAFGSKLNQERITQMDFDPAKLNAPDAISNFATKIEVQQPIINMDAVYLKKAGQVKSEVLKIKAERTKEYIQFEFKKAYMQLQLAYRMLETLENAKTTTLANKKVIDNYFKNGMIQKTEVLYIDVRVKEIENQIAYAKSNIKNASDYLYFLLDEESFNKVFKPTEKLEFQNQILENTATLNVERKDLADGSGVSVYNYISPRLLLEYLKYAYYHREIFLPFYESLPIAGVDGTLQNRMKQTKARGNVHAKTGSVTGVSSLAGYVKAADGHQLAFVIINQNVLKLSRARAFQDKFCDILSR